jgi:hypothetical protein
MHSHTLVLEVMTFNAAYQEGTAAQATCQASTQHKVRTRAKSFQLANPRASRLKGVKSQSPQPSWNPAFMYTPIPKFSPQNAVPTILDSSVRYSNVSNSCFLMLLVVQDLITTPSVSFNSESPSMVAETYASQ